MSNPWIYRAPAIGWGFFILYACLAPVEALSAGIDFEISDKVVHFTFYLVWVVLLYYRRILANVDGGWKICRGAGCNGE
jgi:hypothetical protein